MRSTLFSERMASVSLSVLTAAILSGVSGCGTKAPLTPPGPLSQAIDAWESGDKAGAEELLLTVDWAAPDVTSGAPTLLTLREDEFLSMFRRSQNRVMTEELLPAAKTARDLAQYAISRGQSAQATGDVQTAKRFYEAVLNFGLCLSRPERLATAHLVARAIVAMAEEQLATLE